MKHRFTLVGTLAAVLLAAGLAYTTFADQKEQGKEPDGKPLALDTLSAAVRAALAEIVPGAKLESAVAEEEDGSDVIEVLVTTAAGRKVEVVVTPDGHLVETEEAVDAAALPPAVAKKVAKKQGDGQILEIEKKSVVIYEVKIKTGDKVRELTVNTLGGKTSDDEDDDDDDDDDEDEDDD